MFDRALTLSVTTANMVATDLYLHFCFPSLITARCHTLHVVIFWIRSGTPSRSWRSIYDVLKNRVKKLGTTQQCLHHIIHPVLVLWLNPPQRLPWWKCGL